MIGNLPGDVLETNFGFLDPISLSNLCVAHSQFNQYIQTNKWRIIDKFPGDLQLVKVFPRTQATYNAWRYIIDLTGCLLSKKIVDEDILLEFKESPDMKWKLVCANQKLSENALRGLYYKIPLTCLLTQLSSN